MAKTTSMTDDRAKAAIAQNVRELREQKDWTLSELARRCTTKDSKCYAATIQQIEKADHMPRAGLLARVAQALGVSMDRLFQSPNQRSEPLSAAS